MKYASETKKHFAPGRRKWNRSNRSFSTGRFVTIRQGLTHRKDFGPVNCAITVGSMHFIIAAKGRGTTKTISSFRQTENLTRVKFIMSLDRPKLFVQYFSTGGKTAGRDAFATNVANVGYILYKRNLSCCPNTVTI